MSSACDTEDPDSLLNISRKGKKTGAPRQKAYDNSTCIAITRAMIAAKNDPYRGSDSKGEDFHSRFKAKYDIFARSDFTPRTISSLVDKFKEIRHDCGQFGGILSKVRAESKPSGTTSSDEADIARVPTFIY
jgi:hypothetical protein